MRRRERGVERDSTTDECGGGERDSVNAVARRTRATDKGGGESAMVSGTSWRTSAAVGGVAEERCSDVIMTGAAARRRCGAANGRAQRQHECGGAVAVSGRRDGGGAARRTSAMAALYASCVECLRPYGTHGTEHAANCSMFFV